MNSQPLPERKPKDPRAAFFISLIPLIGLGGCAASAISPWASSLAQFWPLAFLFGVGYLYLERWPRFLCALALPWILIPVTFIEGHYSFGEGTSEAGQTIWPFIIVLGVACFMTAVDALRLAVLDNARTHLAALSNLLGSDST